MPKDGPLDLDLTPALHEDVHFTMTVYARATKRRDRLSGAYRKAYDRAMDWAQMGSNAEAEPLPVPTEATKNPA